MWSNCKTEKLHVIILQAARDAVKGRTNDGALSSLEPFLLGARGYPKCCSGDFSLPLPWMHHGTMSPAQRGLMLQGCFSIMSVTKAGDRSLAIILPDFQHPVLID